MIRRILFPFSSDRDFDRGYSWTMELALRMNATLCFFTVLPQQDGDEKHLIQKIYHSLLAARGNYLKRFSPLAGETQIVKTERLIEKGDLPGSLVRCVKNSRFDLVVLDPSAMPLSAAALKDVVENSMGVIVLPDTVPGREDASQQNDQPASENFYDVLRKADCYQLEGNFFRILGQDKSLFNYLRGIFNKKERSNL